MADDMWTFVQFKFQESVLAWAAARNWTHDIVMGSKDTLIIYLPITDQRLR